MKIQKVGGAAETGTLSSVHAEKTTEVQTAFQRQMTQLGETQHREYIESLASRIFEQGELVAKKADIKELQKYRQMITELLNDAVSNSFEFSKSADLDKRGRHRVFATINKVNAKLDELTQEILEGQKDTLKLLDRVDDIRGMLVDLFL